MHYYISQVAESVRSIFYVDALSVPIEQIEDIIEQLGFAVIPLKGIDDGCVIGQDIYIPDVDSPQYRRLLAHELGHLCLHDFNHYRQNALNLSKYETEADAFAGYFLMSDKTFLNDIKKYQAYELAEIYGTPESFVWDRRKLIDPSFFYPKEEHSFLMSC